jgi:DNA/RNA-binding domain of Phe-tRNA-synthetase-like protein
MELVVDPHPLLDAVAFVTELPSPLAEIVSPPALLAMLSARADAPFESDDATRAAVRDLLRHGGFKPTGRSKPSSEYLLREQAEGRLGPINPVVDACNVVSLWSGIPISVVDADLVTAPLSVRIAAPGTKYVFNRSGQELDLGGLVCLADAEGPCANAVKDSQRTKTHDGTRRTLSLLWGTRALDGRTARAGSWYRSLLENALGARTIAVSVR